MEKTITQQIAEELKLTKPMRTYFDSGSSEFERTDYDEKIRTIGRMISNGYDLKKVIKQYKLNYGLDSQKHVFDDAVPTLKGYISYLNSRVIYDSMILKDLETASDDEVIKLLTVMITEKVAKDNTLENLILSYVDYKFNYISEEYHKLSKFFHIDFERDIDSMLQKRAEKEKVESLQGSYGTLNYYLKNTVFGNIYDNRLSDLNPEFVMPMIKGLMYFINKHYPKSIQERLASDAEFRKSKIVSFAKDLVEVLYLNKPMIVSDKRNSEINSSSKF